MYVRISRQQTKVHTYNAELHKIHNATRTHTHTHAHIHTLSLRTHVCAGEIRIRKIAQKIQHVYTHTYTHTEKKVLDS